MSTDDEEYTVEFNEDEVNQIVKWAIATAGLATLMYLAEQPENVEELIGKMESFDAGISLMVNNMPDCIVDPAADQAQYAEQKYIANEEMIDEFKEELDKYGREH